MKKILSVLFIFIIASCNAQENDKKVETKNNEKMIPMSSTYQKAYSKGGIYYEIGTDKPFTGKLYGKYDNGNFLSIQDYVDGIGNGKWIDFDPMGNKVCEGTYIDNKVEGPVTFYYEDGSIKSTGQYLDWKKPIGEWKYYNKDGKLVHTMTYTP